ncbi:MAG: PP2C family protein-serine/threonine phosphatase [Candidatus Poribacteria bacterium]
MESPGQIRVSGKRHRGRKRNQQDSCFIGLSPAKEGENNDFLLVIADGMSAPGHGDIVSQIATNTAEEVFEMLNHQNNYPQRLFEDIYLKTYDRIRAEIEREPSLEGMGTTLTMAHLRGDTVSYFHVGDSRIYHVNSDNIIQITVDHVPPNGHKNELTQAIGIDFIVPEQRAKKGDEMIITPDTGQFRLSPNDSLVLCSDGLYNTLDDNMIQQIVTTSDTPENACATLIEQSKNSRDNISVIVLQAFQQDALRQPRIIGTAERSENIYDMSSPEKTACEIIRRMHFTIESTGETMAQEKFIDFVQTTGELIPAESTCYYLPETSFSFTSSPNPLNLPFENLPTLIQLAVKRQMPLVKVAILHKLRIERLSLLMSVNQGGKEWIRKLPQYETTISQMQKELTTLMKRYNKPDSVYLFIYENWRIFFPPDNQRRQNSRYDFTHSKVLQSIMNLFRNFIQSLRGCLKSLLSNYRKKAKV